MMSLNSQLGREFFTRIQHSKPLASRAQFPAVLIEISIARNLIKRCHFENDESRENSQERKQPALV